MPDTTSPMTDTQPNRDASGPLTLSQRMELAFPEAQRVAHGWRCWDRTENGGAEQRIIDGAAWGIVMAALEGKIPGIEPRDEQIESHLRAQLAEAEKERDALLETLGRDGEYLKREPTEDEKHIENAEYRGKSVWAWWAKAHAYGHMVHGVNPILGAKDGEHANDAAKRVVAERDALRGQLAEVGRERDAAKIEASKTALLRTMLHNHFCTVLGWEKVREMEGNPCMLANAVSHEVWRCKNRELDFTLLTKERDAAQARVGVRGELLRRALAELYQFTACHSLKRDIEAALAGGT